MCSGLCRGLAALVLVALALVDSRPATGGGFSNVEFGTRRMGMFAVIGRPDDVSAIFHNPAGLTLNGGTTAFSSLAMWLVDARMRLYDSQGTLHPEHDIRPDKARGLNPFLGIVSDFGTERFRAGLAVYAPNVFGTSLPAEEPSRYMALEALFVAARITASTALKVTRKLSIGANLNYLVTWLEASRMMNLAVLSNPDKAFDESVRSGDGRLDLLGLGWAFSFDLGLLLELTPELSLGAMFASGAPVEMTGDVTFTAADGTVTESGHRTTLTIPFTLQGGLNWELAKDFEVGLDLRYWHYQVFQEQRTFLDEPILGISEFVDRKDYDNSFNVGVGLLHRFATDWEFMVGYQRDWSPVPANTVTVDNANNDRQGVCTGIRWQAADELRVGLAYLRNWYDLVENQRSPAMPTNNARGVGSNMALGLDLSWSL